MKRFWSNIIEQKASTSWYKRTLTAFSENSTNLLGHLFDKFVRTPELQFAENIGLSYDQDSDSFFIKLQSGTSVTVVGNNMKPQLVTFKTPSELTGTNAMDFNLNQNWIVYLSGETTTITMTPITKSAVFTCNIEVVQDATGGRDLVLVDVDGKAIVNTQEFDFTSGGANERCFITIKYWLTGYRYLVDKYV
ncbi:MAG: hypothetical protein BWY22_02373 [Bacteroidetes bacterium ADurb.Bin217]|nr:MAG: hypothetical protein BWY22_02373 [Bacteroidetes bacterium ADurb.Bin217]